MCSVTAEYATCFADIVMRIDNETLIDWLADYTIVTKSCIMSDELRFSNPD